MSDKILFTQCPLCGSTNILDLRNGDCSQHPLYNKALNPTLHWKQCSDCTHIFTDGYYTDEMKKIIFEKANERQKVGGQIEIDRVISSKIIEKVLPYASDGIWLDVGFGNGALLFTAQEYGFKSVGIDLRADNVNTMKSLGVDAYCKDINDLYLADKCSVISMADVLEHVPYPKLTLISAKKLLKEGGVLFISMPNTENIVWRILNDQNVNPYWSELEHYHNFSRTRLYSLLNEQGFTPVRYGISERYRACMEVIAINKGNPSLQT